MNNEEVKKRKAELVITLKEVHDEATQLAMMTEDALKALQTVETGEDADAWEDKYGDIEDRFEHIRLF